MNPQIDNHAKNNKRSLPGALSRGLQRTRAALLDGLADVLPGKVDQAALEELETRLLLADVGVQTTARIINQLQIKIKRKDQADGKAIMAALREELLAILRPVEAAGGLPKGAGKPRLIMLVGVNGAGKTTSAGKLARRLQDQGEHIILAAADTFRAAAIEQLQGWGKRSGIAVIAHQAGADGTAVIFDALQAALARGADTVLADTAGRLHTKDNLMAELKKATRVIDKLKPAPRQETLLVIDAGTGQNALIQARQFHEAVGLNGIILTKLDGTAKGGIVFALAEDLKLPIKFIGTGEQADDLRSFAAADFVDALLGNGAT